VLIGQAFLAAQAPQPPSPPKLVVVIVVDQFRYDYLTRFRKDYQAGFARMLKDGAVFTNAHYEQMPTVTAVGRRISLTGAILAVSGIAGNTWFERESGRQVTSVCDYSVKLAGRPRPRSLARDAKTGIRHRPAVFR
jgi:predicted AlkP superfamily pyrophosphatase or phosphodiesterase